MFFKIKDKKDRKGMNLYAIIGGIALAAILGLVVAPRLASAQLPGFRSNLQSDMNSMEELLKSYAANHNGSYRDLSFDANGAAGVDGDLTTPADATAATPFATLLREGILDGEMADGVSALGVYSPSWADGDVAITLTTVGDTRVNVFIQSGVIGGLDDGTGEVDGFENQLNQTVRDFALQKYGNVAISAASSAVNHGGTDGGADQVVDGGTDVDTGTIEYTIR